MASAGDSTGDLLACLRRLADDDSRRANHGEFFRIVVQSRDGKHCAVRLGPISMNRDRPSGKTLNDIADKLRLPREDIGKRLAELSRTQLLQHLSQFTEAELKPPQYRNG